MGRYLYYMAYLWCCQSVEVDGESDATCLNVISLSNQSALIVFPSDLTIMTDGSLSVCWCIAPCILVPTSTHTSCTSKSFSLSPQLAIYNHLTPMNTGRLAMNGGDMNSPTRYISGTSFSGL
ncbi:unnamed protein product [Somion occarium]|uniref:Uncharacterized protein n=1 Tax=Somion occarium TaxID=3059160 RepID=A0ABP1CW13_9APHY